VKRACREIVDEDLTPVGPVEKREESEQGRLAAPGRTDHRDTLAPLHLEVDSAQREDETALVGLVEVLGNNLEAPSH